MKINLAGDNYLSSDTGHAGNFVSVYYPRQSKLSSAQHGATLADGLRFMASSDLGVVAHTLVLGDLSARRLVRAGGAQFEVPFRLILLRHDIALTDQAQRLWDVLEQLKREPCLDDQHTVSTLIG